MERTEFSEKQDGKGMVVCVGTMVAADRSCKDKNCRLASIRTKMEAV